MIDFSSNIEIVIGNHLDKLEALRNNPDPVLRTVAMAVLPALRRRVHVEGLDAAGQPIGEYSPGYMVVRTGNYANAAIHKRGPKAGQPKERKKAGEAGAYTRGTDYKAFGTIIEESDKAGKPRPVYNRTADTKVILSLTRQMENDLSVIDTPEGYGIGYLNISNLEKAKFCELTYGKPILSQLTADELKLATETAQEFLPEYLKELA